VGAVSPCWPRRSRPARTANQAADLGYAYVQGYFLRQAGDSGHAAGAGTPGESYGDPRELRREDPDLRKVEDLFRHDPDLSYKLLRHLNSAAFSFRSRIDTIWRAITILGEPRMRAWTSVVILAGLGGDHPSEVVVNSVTRARFCELVGAELKLGALCEELFLMGLFSHIDVLTSRPMEEGAQHAAALRRGARCPARQSQTAIVRSWSWHGCTSAPNGRSWTR